MKNNGASLFGKNILNERKFTQIGTISNIMASKNNYYLFGQCVDVNNKN